MTIETTGISKLSKMRVLLDAYELREYAVYAWLYPNQPTTCTLIPSVGRDQLCKTEDEYQAFVGHYME
jgi:hypothetical protein